MRHLKRALLLDYTGDILAAQEVARTAFGPVWVLGISGTENRVKTVWWLTVLALQKSSRNKRVLSLTSATRNKAKSAKRVCFQNLGLMQAVDLALRGHFR